MGTPLFFPPPVYVAHLDAKGAVALSDLCRHAGVACKASGAWTERPVCVYGGSGYRIEAEPGGYGVVRIQVPAQLGEVERARHALAAMAYSLMDGVAREVVRGAAWAKPAKPVGRPRGGQALSGQARQRRYRARLERGQQTSM